MKLGIVVVYLFSEASAPLLELHLRHIKQHTSAPYLLYAGVNRLALPFRNAISLNPQVRICECPETSLRDKEEHAHYLDHLVCTAVEDGATHIVTLHLDSLPVRSGWAEELAGRLTGQCVIATIDRINTACLFFHRDFYLSYRPNFLLTPAEEVDPEYRRYLKEYDPIPHSGIGYGFTAYRNGKSWYYLRDTTGSVPDSAGRIYDGMIFHLGGAVRIGEPFAEPSGILTSANWGRFMKGLVAVARSITPRPVRASLIEYFGSAITRVVDRPQYTLQAQEIRRFIEDPESYLLHLLKKTR